MEKQRHGYGPPFEDHIDVVCPLRTRAPRHPSHARIVRRGGHVQVLNATTPSGGVSATRCADRARARGLGVATWRIRPASVRRHGLTARDRHAGIYLSAGGGSSAACCPGSVVGVRSARSTEATQGLRAWPRRRWGRGQVHHVIRRLATLEEDPCRAYRSDHDKQTPNHRRVERQEKEIGAIVVKLKRSGATPH